MSDRHSNADKQKGANTLRENLWAVALALLIIVTFACAGMGTQASFVYTGF